jgi:hypothetical protein
MDCFDDDDEASSAVAGRFVAEPGRFVALFGRLPRPPCASGVDARARSVAWRSRRSFSCVRACDTRTPDAIAMGRARAARRRAAGRRWF